MAPHTRKSESSSDEVISHFCLGLVHEIRSARLYEISGPAFFFFLKNDSAENGAGGRLGFLQVGKHLQLFSGWFVADAR